MIKKSILLLKTLLLSTSQINVFRHTDDKKKKRKIIAAFIGMICLYAMVMGYSITMCIGYGEFGMIDATPVMCALIISLLAFIFTLFRTNGTLFNFREYDLLMSLPLEARTVAGCKFLYMYVRCLPWYLSVSLAMLIGYGIYAKPSVVIYPLWLILTFFLPIIPMLLSAFLGFLITRISAGFRKTNLVQTILMFAFVLLCFSLRFIIEAVFRENKVGTTLEQISEKTAQASRIYLPAGWFAGAVTKADPVGMLLLILVSAGLFAAVFAVVGRSYRNINSALRSHAAAGKYSLSGLKTHSVVQAIAYKEFRRLTGSTNYMVNAAIGEVLALLIGILMLVIGFDKIIAIVTQNAPFDHAILRPAIPLIAYFFIGMCSTTACSPSLEGRNYWIVQSLPITKKTLYHGKMLFNLYLTVPFMLFMVLSMCISAGVPVAETLLYLILGVILCCFSTAWGCVCGIRHLKLDWENEIEVIKQSAAVAIYMLPNMFAVMGLCVLAVILGRHLDHILLTLLFIVIAAILTALSYLRVLSLAKQN